MSLGSQALIASNITMTSSIENVIAVSSGTLAAYRFNGKNFNLWRMKMHAHLESLELTDVIEHPLAATEEEIRALLSVRASDGAKRWPLGSCESTGAHAPRTCSWPIYSRKHCPRDNTRN